ncbi:hypothetical protein [Horticoccus sp. 23ND18S-11]|uniref:hypothetical protein n=1 Tax=Horticoccus sp. 23ND18S-11 TaxID=3391832 RepID=UPI0039C94479
MIDASRDCAVLVPSCDAYSDLWTPFFTLFFRHWPDCPFKIYLGSNSLPFPNPRVTVLTSVHGAKWAERTADHLAQIAEPNVLLCLEDFFLRHRVDTAAVLALYQEFRTREAAMLRLVRRPGPTTRIEGTNFGPVTPGTPYRVSTQAAFWQRSVLCELIVPGETIWAFEHAGSIRSDRRSDGFYAVTRDVLPYKHHVVERGRWFPWEARRFGRMKIGCDFTRRPIMPAGPALRWLALKAKDTVLAPLPTRARARLRALVGR